MRYARPTILLLKRLLQKLEDHERTMIFLEDIALHNSWEDLKTL